MKKLSFLTLALVILFSAHQVSAVSDKANENSSNNPSSEKRNEKSNKAETEIEDEDATITPSVTETEEWKNHGQYVRSVAHTKPGGSVVSAAARSNIGKKKATPSVTVSPTLTPSVTLSPTPTDDPNATPSPTLTETPTPTPTPTELSSLELQIKDLIQVLKDLIKQLKNPFNL